MSVWSLSSVFLQRLKIIKRSSDVWPPLCSKSQNFQSSLAWTVCPSVLFWLFDLMKAQNSQNSDSCLAASPQSLKWFQCTTRLRVVHLFLWLFVQKVLKKAQNWREWTDVWPPLLKVSNNSNITPNGTCLSVSLALCSKSSWECSKHGRSVHMSGLFCPRTQKLLCPTYACLFLWLFIRNTLIRAQKGHPKTS